MERVDGDQVKEDARQTKLDMWTYRSTRPRMGSGDKGGGGGWTVFVRRCKGPTDMARVLFQIYASCEGGQPIYLRVASSSPMCTGWMLSVRMLQGVELSGD